MFDISDMAARQLIFYRQQVVQAADRGGCRKGHHARSCVNTRERSEKGGSHMYRKYKRALQKYTHHGVGVGTGIQRTAVS